MESNHIWRRNPICWSCNRQLLVCSTSLMASLIRSVGGLSKHFYQDLWLAELNADVIGQFINGRGGCLGFAWSRDCFLFLLCPIFVWISLLIPDDMDGPMKDETSHNNCALTGLCSWLGGRGCERQLSEQLGTILERKYCHLKNRSKGF